MSIEARPFAAIAHGYARDVVAGVVPACKSIRLQAKRHLDELEASKREGFPFRFDEDKAARPCRFIERLPHSKGEWAAGGQRLKLEPWQVWIIACTFGWVHESSGLRRFRVLFPVIPRKNGKSAIAAGVGLYMLCADGEFGAEIYSGATTQKQALEVFKPAQLMCRRTPALRARFGIEVSAHTLVRVEDASKFETIIGSPGDGQSPSCSIHDEYHEHADDGQVETMRTGMGARRQPLQILITTAGINLAGPCYARVLEERKRLEGVGLTEAEIAERARFGLGAGPALTDVVFFAEWTIDEDDDWKSEAALRKANPNFGVSVKAEFLIAEQRDAIARPRRAGHFKTKHLNLWVSTKAAFFDVEAWRRCKDVNLPVRAIEALRLEQFLGRRAIASLDLSSKVDLAALDLLILPIGAKATADDPFIVLTWYFLPADTVADNATYSGWHEDGLLTVTDGSIIDYDEILELLREISTIVALEQVAYDPFQATYLVTTMMKEGFPVLEYRPTAVNFSEPMKELDALSRSRRIVHGGCPILEWQISNVVTQVDARGNVYPRKPEGQAHLKIDSVVALIMGVGVALPKGEEEPPVSPWDDPNFSMALA